MFDFVTATGRVGRLHYFAIAISISLCTVAYIFLTSSTNRFTDEVSLHPTFPFVAILGMYAQTVNMIRRLHDLGHNGWMALLSLVPIIGFGLNLYVLFARGDRVMNLYGYPPGSDGPQAGPAHRERMDAITAHAGESYRRKTAAYANDDGSFDMDGLANESPGMASTQSSTPPGPVNG